jgi:hypothetical protein
MVNRSTASYIIVSFCLELEAINKRCYITNNDYFQIYYTRTNFTLYILTFYNCIHFHDAIGGKSFAKGSV